MVVGTECPRIVHRLKDLDWGSKGVWTSLRFWCDNSLKPIGHLDTRFTCYLGRIIYPSSYHVKEEQWELNSDVIVGILNGSSFVWFQLLSLTDCSVAAGELNSLSQVNLGRTASQKIPGRKEWSGEEGRGTEKGAGAGSTGTSAGVTLLWNWNIAKWQSHLRPLQKGNVLWIVRSNASSDVATW